MSNFVGYKPSPLSVLVQGVRKVLTGGKSKTTGTEVIKNVPIAKNIDTKRNIQDKVVSAVDKGIKQGSSGAPISESTKKYASKLKKDKSKELKNYSYTADKIENKAKGGRVGLKGGSDLGMQSVKYGLDKKPEVTKLDRIAKFIAKDKKKKKKFESPMAKAIKKKNKKRFV
jgi:hypothetical protein